MSTSPGFSPAFAFGGFTVGVTTATLSPVDGAVTTLTPADAPLVSAGPSDAAVTTQTPADVLLVSAGPSDADLTTLTPTDGVAAP